MRFENSEKVKDGFYSALVGAILVVAFLLAQNSFARSWDFDQGPAAAVVTSIQGNIQTYVKTKEADGCEVSKLAIMLTGYVNKLVDVDAPAGPVKGEIRKLVPEEKDCLKRATKKLMDIPNQPQKFLEALDGIDQVFDLHIQKNAKKA